MDDLTAYDYRLPKELIAQHPLPQRADARLLVVDRARGEFDLSHVRELPHWLGPGDLLVLNDTRVLWARLVGYRQRTGGRWQGLYLEELEPGVWKVLSRTRGKLEPGETIILQDREAVDRMELAMLAPLDEGAWAARIVPQLPADRVLERLGRVPLPPYIRSGQMVDDDLERYQTVYAREPGSIAAPTAGLHLTPSLLEQLEVAGVQLERVTLHVGVGTFRPIKVDRLSAHRMHAEWGRVAPQTAERLRAARQAGKRIVALGTTVVRLLETAACHGSIEPFEGHTDLFIRPPFTFHAVDALMTNFHLPRSSLLVLVRTFGGDELIRRAYELAVAERFRFYSYGDAMLIL